MRRITVIVGVLLVLANLATFKATAQSRPEGISVHMLPKRVAEIGGKPWGFTVDYSSRLKPEHQAPVIQTVSEVLSFIRKPDAGVQENGLWIVTTNPDAYSEEEKSLLEDVSQRENPNLHMPCLAIAEWMVARRQVTLEASVSKCWPSYLLRGSYCKIKVF